MDLLQRIQRWYTINCNGDWEHSYGVSIWHGISVRTLDNPGWIVTINLAETCLQTTPIPYVLQERSETNWVGYKVENDTFEAIGGPENLAEILAYFLNEFLPKHINPECTLDVHLPIRGYENQLWLKAEAKMLSESVLEVVSIADSTMPTSYVWNTDTDMNIILELEDQLSTFQVGYVVGDTIEPSVFQPGNNIFNTFLAAPIL